MIDTATDKPLVGLTTGQFMHTLREVVAERGADYVHRGPCVYRRDDKPSCLIGHVLDRLGVVTDKDHEGTGAFGLLHLLLGASEEVAGIAERAQDAQDNRRPWGEALAAAERELEEAA